MDIFGLLFEDVFTSSRFLRHITTVEDLCNYYKAVEPLLSRQGKKRFRTAYLHLRWLTCLPDD